MKMNSVCTAVGLVLLATGCVSQKADPNLVFHCTFDDVQSILSPAAGLPGKVDGAKFVDGKFGKALYVPAYAAAAEFPFPNGLPSECGTIEFWAKLEGGKPTFTSSGDPYLFAFVDDKTSDIVFETHFNANNGCGKSVLSLACLARMAMRLSLVVIHTPVFWEKKRRLAGITMLSLGVRQMPLRVLLFTLTARRLENLGSPSNGVNGSLQKRVVRLDWCSVILKKIRPSDNPHMPLTTSRSCVRPYCHEETFRSHSVLQRG